MATATKTAALALAAITLTAPTKAPALQDPLEAYRWKSRVVIIAAAEAGDARAAEQRKALSSAGRARDDRDLVVLEAVGDDAPAVALRRRLGIPSGVFRAVLLGKDGAVKLSSGDPIPPETLFATIDAMPMRREEMRRR